MPIIAEIGSNHLGDLSRAKEMIHVIADCGADFAKFQFFYKEQYPHNIETPLDWYDELQNTCNKYGVGFLYSVFYKDEKLKNNGLIKIAFSQRYNFPLVKYYEVQNLIISSNEKTYFYRDYCNHILLYCVPQYPAQIENYRLLEKLGYFEGASDHTIGIDLFKKYYPMKWYEKHFKLGDEGDRSPDAGDFAITPKELKEICQK